MQKLFTRKQMLEKLLCLIFQNFQLGELEKQTILQINDLWKFINLSSKMTLITYLLFFNTVTPVGKFTEPTKKWLTLLQIKSVKVSSSSPMYSIIFLLTQGRILRSTRP